MASYLKSMQEMKAKENPKNLYIYWITSNTKNKDKIHFIIIKNAFISR